MKSKLPTEIKPEVMQNVWQDFDWNGKTETEFYKHMKRINP